MGKKHDSELVSVRNVNATLSLACIVISAAVCTVLAVMSGNKAVDDTDSGCDAAIGDTEAQCDVAVADSFDAAEDNVMRTTNALMNNINVQVMEKLANYLREPEKLAGALKHRLSTMHPSDNLDWPTFKGLRHELYAQYAQYQGSITAIGVFNARGHMLMYIEDEQTMPGSEGWEDLVRILPERRSDPWRRLNVVWNDGAPFHGHDDNTRFLPGDSSLHDRCPAGKPCSYWADIVPSGGSDMPDGSWPATGDCPHGDCNGTWGFGEYCEVNRFVMEPFVGTQYSEKGKVLDAAMAKRIADLKAGKESALYHEAYVDGRKVFHVTQNSPINWMADHSLEKWATGPCPMNLPVQEQEFWLLGMLLLQAGTMKWTPIMPQGPYMGMMLIGNYMHPAMNAAPWSDEAVAGKMGMFLYGLDARIITDFLTSLPEPGTRMRIFVVVGGDWLGDMGVMDSSIGNLAGVSHGQPVMMVEEWSPIWQKYSRQPKGQLATNASDTIIRASAQWIMAQGGYQKVSWQAEERGSALKYTVTHTETPGGEQVTEDFYCSASHYTGSPGVDFWAVVTVDHESMLGAIDRVSAETRDAIAASKQAVQRRVQAGRDSVKEQVEEDQTVLAVVVVVVAMVLVVVSVVFISMVTAPLKLLAREMNDVACMQLDGIDDHQQKSRLAEVRKMQRSFLRMVHNMRELRNYMPQSLLAAGDDGDAEEDELCEASQRGDGSTMGSQSKKSARSRSAARSHHSRSHAKSAAGGGVASTMASSQSAAMRAYLQKVAGQGLKKRKVSILVANVVEFHKACEGDTVSTCNKLEAFLTACLGAAVQTKGITDSFSGDRVTNSFNAVKPLGTHRTAVALCAAKCATDAGTDVRLTFAATTGDAQCGNAGCAGLKKFCIFSGVMTFAYGLERYARQCGARGVVCDKWILDDVRNSFNVQNVGSVEFAKRSKKPVPVGEVKDAKKVSEDEWMYQLEEGAKQDPYGAWNACIEAAQGGDWAAAEEASKKDKMPELLNEPGTGAWLQGMLSSQTPPTTVLAFH